MKVFSNSVDVFGKFLKSLQIILCGRGNLFQFGFKLF